MAPIRIHPTGLSVEHDEDGYWLMVANAMGRKAAIGLHGLDDPTVRDICVQWAKEQLQGSSHGAEARP